MTIAASSAGWTSLGFPATSPLLEEFGVKFSGGGAHISRTMMLTELHAVLTTVPVRSDAASYREAIMTRNVLSKTTESTKQKSLRHLRELYALDENIALFRLLRELHEIAPESLPLLAVQVAWARDPLFRATTGPIMESPEGARVETVALSEALEASIPDQYSTINRNKIARNAASSWTQSGHLKGRGKKIRARFASTPTAVTLALALGHTAGFHGPTVFTNPWCRLLDLSADQARNRAFDAHRAGLLNLRAVGEIVELSFPRFASILPESA